jgi:hypothetical protein
MHAAGPVTGIIHHQSKYNDLCTFARAHFAGESEQQEASLSRTYTIYACVYEGDIKSVALMKYERTSRSRLKTLVSLLYLVDSTIKPPRAIIFLPRLSARMHASECVSE